jgi:geranylgeranyl diphosphate synthase, type I
VLERFERALEETVSVLLQPMGASPIGEQVKWHFGIGTGGGGPRRGKRLRPQLLFNAAFEEGGTFEQAVDAAIAIECLHNYSLVHDDIEDGDKLRHGSETVWARYGVAHGVNAGDSMCAVSYLALLRNTAALPSNRIVAMMQVLHYANLGMCAGQGYDIGFETAANVTREEYFAMIDGKTAALFGAACELGARAAGCSDERATAYGELGRCYGRAFQIRDDVLGTWGSTEETGKPSGSDIARRKWSFPVVWALSGESSPARDAIARRYALRTTMDAADVRAIVDALDALGSRAAADEAVDAQLRHAEGLAERYQIDRGHTVRTLFTRSARRVA